MAVLGTKQACAQCRNASDLHETRMLLHLPSTAGYLPRDIDDFTVARS